jgi:hypothetical protein
MEKKSIGQFAYEMWKRDFGTHTVQNWENLPNEEKESWEDFAEEVSMEYIDRNDYYR